MVILDKASENLIEYNAPRDANEHINDYSGNYICGKFIGTKGMYQFTLHLDNGMLVTYPNIFRKELDEELYKYFDNDRLFELMDVSFNEILGMLENNVINDDTNIENVFEKMKIN
jgi:hypothetical protein